MSEERGPAYTYPGLDEQHKILNLLWVFPVEKRRGAYCIAILFAYTIVYGYAAPIFGYDGLIVGIVLGPLAAVTMIVALCRYKGHYLEWWLFQFLKNFRRSVLIFKKRDEENPLKKVRNSVQDALKLDDISWYWVRTTDGVYLLVLRVMPYTISMASPEERNRLWRGVARYYRTIDFPVIELARNRPGSTRRYQRDAAKSMEAELSATDDPEVWTDLRAFAEAHLTFAETITEKYSIYDRSAHLMIPYDPHLEAANKSYGGRYNPKALLSKIDQSLFRRPNASQTAKQQADEEEIAGQLMMRAELVASCLAHIGCKVELLGDNELLAFFMSQTVDTEEDPEEPPLKYAPIVFESRKFEKLSQAKLNKVIEAAEPYRSEAPPTVGTAQLSVRDNVAPDAVVRGPDTSRIGPRHHKTRYITKLCDFVQLGVLRQIEAMEDHIKLTKFIYPKSADEGAKAYGQRFSELKAAARTDNDGNEITKTQKAIAQESAQQAMYAILNGEQGYTRVSILIHMEAATPEELEALDYRVYSALNGASIESRVASEESWEGFLSNLPLGRNYLTASTEFGLMTDPLAGLFSFTSPNLQHEGGGAILLGLDNSADGQPVMIDDWQMPRPGSLTLGPPDTGKTYKTKADSSRKRSIGDRINIIDPAANSYYGEVAKRIGGVHAALAIGSPNKINPFDLYDNYMALHMLTDAIAESVGDQQEVERRARSYAIDGKVMALEEIVRLMVARKRGLSEDEESVVQSALYECYRLAGITNDPDTHSKPTPTFSGDNECDFFNVLRARKARAKAQTEESEDSDDGEAEVIQGLLRKLKTWDSGTLREMFDSQTTVDAYNKYLVFQVASVDEKAKPAVMAGVMECISGVLSNPTERAHLYVDEAHNLLYDEDSAAYLGNWTRTGRVRDTSVHLISQNTREFTDTPEGEVIRENVGTTYVFQQSNPEAAGRIGSIYGLSEFETRELEELEQGECYLIAGPSRHRVQVLASPEEDHFFDTSPGSDARRKKRKAEQQEAERLRAARPDEDRTRIPDAYIPPKASSLKDSSSKETGPSGPEAEKGTRVSSPTADQAHGSTGAGPHSDDDTGEVPVQDDAPAADSGDLTADVTREIPTTGAYLPALPGEGGEEPTRIYAFSGEGSASVAATVAKLLGKEAEVRDLRVLALDAIQTELGHELGVSTSSPDPYLQAADSSDLDGLGNYLTRVPDSGELFYMEGPAATFLSAKPLMAAIRQVFDCVLVACPAVPTVYSAEWLLAADRVVGCSPERAKAALEAALSAESARGINGTLLATSAQPADADELDEEPHSRALFAALSDDQQARLSLTTKLITESEDQEEAVTHE